MFRLQCIIFLLINYRLHMPRYKSFAQTRSQFALFQFIKAFAEQRK